MKPPRKLGWRLLRWGLIGLAVLVTLAALFVTEENWRGKRAWENTKAALEAKGAVLDWNKYIPPPVPDDQNFFAAPIFTELKKGNIAMTPYGRDGGPDSIPYKDLSSDQVGYIGGEGRGIITDLKRWQAYYRNPSELHAVVEYIVTNGNFASQTKLLNHAADAFPIAPQPQTPAKDVLLALSKYDPEVEQLREASQRPYANVPLNYKDWPGSVLTLLPVFPELKKCTQLLRLRATAELADGQSDKALADVKLMLYFNHSLRTSPFLISYLVRIAIVAIDMQPIWEGLAERQWTDGQLASLEAELGKMDFLADCEFVMRGERAFGIASLENQRRTHAIVTSKPGTSGYVTNRLIMPAAYFYQSELALARVYQQWILPLVDTNARIISPAAVQRANDAYFKAKKRFSPYSAQAWRLVPVLTSSVAKTAAIQSTINLARVACALERYRLAHGEYPESLDALAPRFIAEVPHDIINGQPLHYRREADGQFLLYSIGWDGKDDGGKVFLDANGGIDRKRGDWVWQYPTQNN